MITPTSGTWFEITVRLEKMVENGLTKTVTEKYVEDAISFTEAEADILKHLEPYVTGGIEVTAIKRAAYGEVFRSDSGNDDKWYLVRLQFLSIDGRTGKEKKTVTPYLVQASDLETAKKNAEEAMKSTMSDYTFKSVVETKILDLFRHEAE